MVLNLTNLFKYVMIRNKRYDVWDMVKTYGRLKYGCTVNPNQLYQFKELSVNRASVYIENIPNI